MRARLMEVCGTHTMAIAKAGIKRLLPPGVELVSGPGCPVCVTPPELMDAALELASRPGVTVASYGDMLRVPGTRRGDDLAHRRARGGSVELVYSPMDAVELAKKHPEREVVFLGVGFETTAPGTAASVLAAREQGVGNYSGVPDVPSGGAGAAGAHRLGGLQRAGLPLSGARRRRDGLGALPLPA